ncbi:MAG TPA: DnaJ domain-containing protein [Candidatus Paceibacterota bacterium]|nr:DnaJ domain-containing protein [Verrucomicrobiota bacterium]HRY51547.1 DnaJ domain-containing protein [Candidatus Paceibacterota bacterium]HRZ99660.1 DnaJ domain-containing protein [Candidatus Paceibacterota bacterium]
MAKDLYVVLGVDSGSSQEEIKSAYRQRAKECHPDHYGPDAAPFRAVQEAYLVLGDPVRRRIHDEELRLEQQLQRSPRRSRAEPFRPSHSRAEPLVPPRFAEKPAEYVVRESFEDYHPSFGELFDRWDRNFRSQAHPKAERLESLTVEVLLSPEEAMAGGRVRILMPVQSRCPDCGGCGAVGRYECWNCRGQGGITTDAPIDVTYPVGIANEYAVQLPLRSLGIDNFFLTVWFRVSDSVGLY